MPELVHEIEVKPAFFDLDPMAVVWHGNYVKYFEHARSALPSWVELEARPVDAQQVPDDLPGFRLVCNGFHHLRPEQARACLLDAVRQGRGVALVELTSRSALSVTRLSLVGGCSQK